MPNGFLYGTLGRTGLTVHRLGLSATYRPGRATIHRALDAGLNYFFCFGIDGQMIRVLRDLPPRARQRLVIATGAYNYLWWRQGFRRTLHKRLRQLRTDYLDVFLYLGVTARKHFPEAAQEELAALRATGQVRAVGLSTHDRALAGELAARGAVDVLMVRYNAAHRGAEQDIFPHLAAHNPGIVSFTATRWRALLHRPRGWPRDGRVPTAGECYRFVLSNPHVDVCLTAPTSLAQFEATLAAVAAGPPAEDELAFMRTFGDVVYRRQRWFM